MHLRQFAFPGCTCSSTANFLWERRLCDFSGLDFTVMCETVDLLGFIGVYGHAARRRQVADNLKHEIGANADNVLRFINN